MLEPLQREDLRQIEVSIDPNFAEEIELRGPALFWHRFDDALGRHSRNDSGYF